MSGNNLSIAMAFNGKSRNDKLYNTNQTSIRSAAALLEFTPKIPGKV